MTKKYNYTIKKVVAAEVEKPFNPEVDSTLLQLNSDNPKIRQRVEEVIVDSKIARRNNKQISQELDDIVTKLGLEGIPYSEIAENAAGGEVDEYFYYSKSYYTITNNATLFPNAWEDMKEVDGAEIERESTFEVQYGKLQYPNGEDNGVIIPNSVTSIGMGAFMGWTSNNQPLVIPDSVTSIEEGAFMMWLANNQPLVIPNSVTSIGQNAFEGWEANNQPLVIPNSVTSIGQYAFYNWRANTHPLVIPNSVTSIGDGAFRDWTANNQPLVIPNSVTSIGEGGFVGWESNNHPLIIGNSVTSIGGGAFEGWTNVPYVEMKSETPPTLINSNAFSSQNDAPIYVPDESVDDYKNATNWANLASRIKGIGEKP